MADELTVEGLAKEMGWADQDGWKGDPDQWKPAAEFIRDAQSISVDKGSEIIDLKQKIDGLSSELREMGINQARQIKVATDHARERLEKERSQAVEDGDTARFTAIDEQIRKIPDTPEPDVQRRQVEFQKGLQTFIQKNPWYNEDLAMQTYANTVGQNLGNANPNIQSDQYYQTVEELVRAQFPGKFANDKPSSMPAVSPDKPAPKGSSLWSQLKSQYPEAEATFNDLVKREIFTAKDREKYAKEVLEI